jgi:hypothetical protein
LVYLSVFLENTSIPFFRCRGRQIKELTTRKH